MVVMKNVEGYQNVCLAQHIRSRRLFSLQGRRMRHLGALELTTEHVKADIKLLQAA